MQTVFWIVSMKDSTATAADTLNFAFAFVSDPRPSPLGNMVSILANSGYVSEGNPAVIHL